MNWPADIETFSAGPEWSQVGFTLGVTPGKVEYLDAVTGLGAICSSTTDPLFTSAKAAFDACQSKAPDAVGAGKIKTCPN